MTASRWHESGGRRRGQLFVAGAAVAWSTAGVLQRELSVGTTTQIAGRALFACLALAAFVAATNRGTALAAFRSMGAAGLAVAVCTALASGSFIVALNHATVANVVFMQALAPVGAALIAWFALREPITRRGCLSIGVAILGVGLMVGAPGSSSLLGLVTSLVMTLSFSVGIVITRHRRDVSMAPAVCLSQLLLVLSFGAFAQPTTATPRDLWLLVLLGVGQMALGLALLTVGARLIPAPEVAVITLLEVILAPLWVWLALSERPPTMTLVGGAVVILGVLLLATERTRTAAVTAPSVAPDAAH